MGSIHRAPTRDVRSKLNLEEKISLLAAKDWWRTPVIQRDNVFVPHIKVSPKISRWINPRGLEEKGWLADRGAKTTDGPNGARGESYVSGIKAACFPCSTSMGATFDVDILYETGRQIAKEAITKSANVLLAPTVNVIRSPLGELQRTVFQLHTHTNGRRNYQGAETTRRILKTRWYLES
jgi:beta-glucosidase